MNKAKGKGGIGRGTGKQGWNRWKSSANKSKNAKPNLSNSVKKSDGSKDISNNKGNTSG